MAFQSIKVTDIELSQQLADLTVPNRYKQAQVLVRWQGAPLGTITVPLINGRCAAALLWQQIEKELSWPLIRRLLWQRLANPLPQNGLEAADLVREEDTAKTAADLPLVTVAVCTRNRADNLRHCLAALAQLDYPHLDILIVDNAPDDETTRELVQKHHPQMRYVCEPRPGLDWARNRAILEAKGEIIAYTDDDVMVDRSWVRALVRPFADNPYVMAVTGLVVPYELETKAQHLFEKYGGFGRGFQRLWVSVEQGKRWRWTYYGTGRYGTGANMAYRRELFDRIGPFDPALDVGTATNGGGDLEMFFRVLKEGHMLVYEPTAVVYHRHRRRMSKLRQQLANNGTGFFSYVVRSLQHYPDERISFAKLGIWWFQYWSLRRLFRSFFGGTAVPRSLIVPEIIGSLRGLVRYQKARRQAARIAQEYGPLPFVPLPRRRLSPPQVKRDEQHGMAVRHLELAQPITGIHDVKGYAYVRLFVTCDKHMLGSTDIANNFQPLGCMQLRQIIAEQFGLRLLDVHGERSDTAILTTLQTMLKQRIAPNAPKPVVKALPPLAEDVPISIVVATLDRPDDLRVCLHHLMAQQTRRPIEIVVVDNNPTSGLTPPVIADFPGVILVEEPRRGLAYARNAGFAACTGKIAIATDDDVEVPPHWVESIVAPFARPEVMAVTGNVLPKELENTAQHSFENYGGLGRGYKRFEADRNWFEGFKMRGVHTWDLGATANAAFRTSIFSHPKIGLMDEALGPGMPSGVGEDTYLFYKILKADYTIVYEPTAYVWHKHRRTMKALRKQLFNYSKGHVAYHLTTVLRDGDKRGLMHAFVHLPHWRLKQIAWHVRDLFSGRLFRGQGHYPVSLTAVEIWGNLLGPWALWQSRKRVQREGRSAPYLPVPQRAVTVHAHSNGAARQEQQVGEKTAV